MINRMFYKDRAKMNLQGKWLIAALVALVYLIANGQKVFQFNFESNTRGTQNIGDQMTNQLPGILPHSGTVTFFRDNVSLFLPIVLIGILAGIVFQIFVMNPLSVGPYQYFRKNDLGEESMGMNDLLWAFRSKHYLDIVKTLFLMNLKIVLWTLLFIIPGVIKAYEYSMIPFLLARNKNMTSAEAFSASKFLTEGNKMDLFVLDLSFIGWYLLGAIPFGLGTPFVKAYEFQTRSGIFNDWVGDTEPDYRS